MDYVRDSAGAGAALDVREALISLKVLVAGGFGQDAERLARDDQNLRGHRALGAHAVGDLAVRRWVFAEGEQRGVLVGRNGVGCEGSVHSKFLILASGR